MLWGGLKPIRRRFSLDIATLTALGFSALIPLGTLNTTDTNTGQHYLHLALLILSCLVTFITAGLTLRWTISFPMSLIVLMQYSRYHLDESYHSLLESSIQISSLFMVGLAFLLTILFPAVNIKSIDGKYNVGVVDLDLPVDNFEGNQYVYVRLLYPTIEKTDQIPYLITETADQMCKGFMSVAPPPFNKFGFMLNQWKLATINAKRNAVPHFPARFEEEEEQQSENIDNDRHSSSQSEDSKLPIVVFSHGITGTAEIYSYQAMSMAANGSLVMSITHSDGSAIGITPKDGSFIAYDNKFAKLGKEKGIIEAIRLRRKQMKYRTNEFLAATEALIQLNETNISELEQIGISFVNRLEVKDCIAAGHSYGGATAFNAAVMKNHLYSACIAHDPAVDWCTDEARKALLPRERFEGSKLAAYSGGTGGYEEVEVDDGNTTTEEKKNHTAKDPTANHPNTKLPSIHDLDLFLLYSYEWKLLGWGEYRSFHDLFKRGLLGRANGPSDLGFVYNAHHSEFSDSCMKIPLWLSRAVKMTGVRNPHETAEEIMTRTSSFIAEVRRQKQGGFKEKRMDK